MRPYNKQSTICFHFSCFSHVFGGWMNSKTMNSMSTKLTFLNQHMPKNGEMTKNLKHIYIYT